MNLSKEALAAIATLDLNNLDLRALEKLPRSVMQELQGLLTPKMTQYIPHVPTAKQSAFMLLDNKEAFYGGAAGGGKALSLDTIILTDNGWKTFGNIDLCDKVLAVDGSWTSIEYVTDVQYDHDCMSVELSNGEVILADAEHLWAVTEYKNRKYWVDSTCTTRDLQIKTKIQKAQPMMGTVQQLPIDPYLLGYWLGDGVSRSGVLSIGDQDIDEVREYLPELYKVPSEKINYRIAGLTEQLRELNVKRSWNATRVDEPEVKHIPEQYLLSSFEQRLELLRGIMDSDGSIQERGRCEIGLKEQNLSDSVCTLLASLGVIYSRGIAPTKCKGKDCPSHRITFSTTLDVFKLTRKKDRLPTKVLDNKIAVVSVMPTPSVPVRCIRIKHPSHTFLVGRSLTPTHNSDCLLMIGLQYVDIKGYAGIIFRKNYSDLVKPGALIDRSKEWLFRFPNVRWVEKEKKFEFLKKYGPHTEVWSILQFGYLETDNDRFNYQGGEYQYIGFDELTHMSLVVYQYLFSRLRKLKHVQMPLRVRGASNPPDDDQGAWVYDRFVNPAKKRPGSVFISAGLDDNPYLDKDSYIESLNELDPVTRARLKDGLWTVVRKGNMFKRDWFETVDSPPPMRRRVRYWDMASTVDPKKKKGKGPDYTCGFLLSEYDGIYYVEDIIRVRKRPAETNELQKSAAKQDGYRTAIGEEQEPGSSGDAAIDMKARTILKGYNYKGIRSSGSKILRAEAASAAVERGHVKIVRGCRNVEAFLLELESFPGGLHDDMVDGFSGAFNMLRNIPQLYVPIAISNNDGSYWSSFGDSYTEDVSGYFTNC